MTGADSSSSGQGQRALPIADAAELLGVSIETLRKRLQRGREKGYKDTDGTWRVLVDPPAPEPEPVPTAPPAPAEPPPQIVEMLERLSAQVDDLKRALAHQTTLSNALATEVRRLGSETRESLAALQALILSVEVEVAAQDDDRAKRLKKKLKPVLLMIVDLLQRRQSEPAPLPAAPPSPEPVAAGGTQTPMTGVTAAALAAAAATALADDRSAVAGSPGPAPTADLLEAGEALPAAPSDGDDWQALSDLPTAADPPARPAAPEPAESTLILRDPAPAAASDAEEEGGLAFVEEDDEAPPGPAPAMEPVEAGGLAFEDDDAEAASAVEDGQAGGGATDSTDVPESLAENEEGEEEEPLLLTDPLEPTADARLASEAPAGEPADRAVEATDPGEDEAPVSPVDLGADDAEAATQTEEPLDSGSLSPTDIAALLRSMETAGSGEEAPDGSMRATAPPLPDDAPDGLDALFDPPPPSTDPSAGSDMGPEADLDAIWSDLPVEDEPDPAEADPSPDVDPPAFDPTEATDPAATGPTETATDPVLDFADDGEDDPWTAPIDPPPPDEPTAPDPESGDGTEAPRDPAADDAPAPATSDSADETGEAEVWDAPITDDDLALIDPGQVDPTDASEAFDGTDDGPGEALLDWTGTEAVPDDTPTEVWDADTADIPALDNLDTDLPERPAADGGIEPPDPAPVALDPDDGPATAEAPTVADDEFVFGAGDAEADETGADEAGADGTGVDEAEPTDRAFLDDAADETPSLDPWEEPTGDALLPWDADAADTDPSDEGEGTLDTDEAAAAQSDPEPEAETDTAEDFVAGTGDDADLPFADKGSASPARPRQRPVSAAPLDGPDEPDAPRGSADHPAGLAADRAPEPLPETADTDGSDGDADDPFAKWNLPGIDDFDAPEEEAERTVSIRDPFALDGEFLLDFGAEDGEDEEFEDPLALSDDAISWDELEEPANEEEAADPPGDAAAEKADKTDRG